MSTRDVCETSGTAALSATPSPNESKISVLSFNVEPVPGLALIEVVPEVLFVAEATIGVVWFTPVSVITDMPVFAVPVTTDKVTLTDEAVDVALSSTAIKYISFLIPLAAIDAFAPSATKRD